MGYFSLWYNQQKEEIKEEVKKYIQNGQLDIVNGGWSANDEATPDFDDILNNMMIGHEFMKKEFGV